MIKENDENDQLISFKTAELAKEKGFNWETQAVFTDFNKVPYSNPQEETPYNWNSRAGYAAPTQSLLQKWLRDIHKIHIFINNTNNNKWSFGIQRLSIGVLYLFDKQLYDSYEEALEIGIQEVLKLIVLKEF